MRNGITTAASFSLFSLILGCAGGNGTISQPDARDSSTLAATNDPETGATGQSPEGWTILRPSADSRLIYVSSSQGNDANNGLSENAPKATLSAAAALLRDGFPDWLLLKRGDIFDTSLMGFGWNKSGRSADEPTVMSSYGTGTLRPRIHSGTWDGLSSTNNPSVSPIRHVAIVGVHFFASGYTGSEWEPKGLGWHADFENLLIEDCRFEKYFGGMVVEVLDGPRGQNLRIRRCQVLDSYTTLSGHSGGVYINAVDGILLEENLIDHNGWSETVPGAVPTIFRHNVYVQSTNTGLRAIGNLIASGGSHGMQARPGGLVENNLFVNNAMALLLGTSWTTYEDVNIEAKRNVILTGRDLTPSLPRGWGIEVVTTQSGLVQGNIIANNGDVGFPVPLGVGDVTVPTGVHNLVIEDNKIYNWGGHSNTQGVYPLISGLVFRRNFIVERDVNSPLLRHLSPISPSYFQSSENRFWTRVTPLDSWFRNVDAFLSLDQWRQIVGDTTSRIARPNFRDPSRDLGAYNAHLGGANSFREFLTHARGMSKRNWDSRYTAAAVNDWIREGFEPAD